MKNQLNNLLTRYFSEEDARLLSTIMANSRNRMFEADLLDLYHNRLMLGSASMICWICL